MTGRLRILALAMLAPSVLIACSLVAVETYRLANPNAQLFGDPPAASFLEAVRRGNQGMEEAYRFVADGLDPNGPLVVSDEDLTGRHTVTTTPLMLAIAAGNRNVVMMLLNFGGRLDLPQHRLAPCMAKFVGNEDVIDLVEEHTGVDVATACPSGLAAPDAPLLLTAR